MHRARDAWFPCRAAILGLAVLAISGPGGAPSALAASAAEIAASFNQVVFGAEYSARGRSSVRARKFVRPVAIQVINRSRTDRQAEAEALIRRLAAAVPGARISLAGRGRSANFRLWIVDRAQYQDVVRREVFRAEMPVVPGRCLVRVASNGGRIRSSDAVIVADEGDFVFRRCLVEELLQGLGPLADASTLPDSVFNNQSEIADLSETDLAVLNVLYDQRIRPGMTERQAAPVLARILAGFPADQP